MTAGAHAGPNVTIDFSHLYHKRITIKGRPGYHPPDVAKCFLAAAEGKVRAQIERVLPLSRAAEAHRLIESGEATGKLVLDPTQGKACLHKVESRPARAPEHAALPDCAGPG